MNIIEIEAFIIMTLAIPLIFKLKNWLFIKQNLTINKWEEYAVLLFFFTVLLSYGFIVKQTFPMLLSGSFLYWIIYDAIKFDIKLWKEFLGIYKRR